MVSPGYTAGLEGTPNELKLKYLADHDFGDLSGEALQQAVAQKIREKDAPSVWWATWCPRVRPPGT